MVVLVAPDCLQICHLAYVAGQVFIALAHPKEDRQGAEGTWGRRLNVLGIHCGEGLAQLRRGFLEQSDGAFPRGDFLLGGMEALEELFRRRHRLGQVAGDGIGKELA